VAEFYEKQEPHPEYNLSWYGWMKVGREFFEIMLDEIKTARAVADMRIQAAKPQAGRQIAYRIRAELVCCRIYHDVQKGLAEHPEVKGSSHTLCYWGEAAALIAESMEQWENDPHNFEWHNDEMDARAAQRRERRRQGDDGDPESPPEA